MTATLEQLQQLEKADRDARESLKNEMILELGRLRADINADFDARTAGPVSYTHLRAHET